MNAGNGTTTVTASARSATDRAYASILHNTLTGTYRAGERLKESRLTAEFGLSRIPVREALKRLALEGVIDLHPHRGAVIRVTTRRDMVEFFQARAMLEGTSAHLAAGRVGETDCASDRAALIRHRNTLRGWAEEPGACTASEYAAHNQQFHELVVALSGNGLLARLWTNLQLPAQRLDFVQRYRPGDVQGSVAEHSRIADSILAGDGQAAERHAREHTNRVAATVHSLADDDFNHVFNPGLTSAGE